MLERHRERVERAAGTLEELERLARRLGAGATAASLARDGVERLRRGRFHLVVVGEFNHGKSSFVNALLGQQVLPVGVTPTTAAIHHLVHEEQPRAKAVQVSGEEVEVPLAELARYATETEGGAARSEALRYLEVGVPSPLLREGVVLVDTPGVNDLSLTRAEITFDYVPRADAVLFVLDAGQPVKDSERQFLQEQLLARSRDKIVFVVAKADLWTSEERAQALPWIRARLEELVPAPQVFAVSAERALHGARAESGLPELEAHLLRFLAEERGRLLLINALDAGRAAHSVLTRSVEARRRALELEATQLRSRIELLEADLARNAGAVAERRLLLREEASAIKAWARRDLERFVQDLVARLPALLAEQSGEDVRLHLGAFLNQAFGEWAAAETQEISAALTALAERMLTLMQADAQSAGQRAGEEMRGDLATPSVEIDTFAYDVGVLAMLSAGLLTVLFNAMLGGALLVAAPVLALWSKRRADAATRERALELAPAALRDAASKVAPKLDELVDTFAARLEEWVVTVGEELFQELLEVLRTVEAERAAAGVSRARLLEEVAEQRAQLAALGEALEGLRADVG